MLDFLSIRFSKQQTREMFDYLDQNNDGKLSYQDFINLQDMIEKNTTTAQDSNSQVSQGTAPSISVDPFLKMAKDVEQRKEFDIMEWDEDLNSRSKQQKKYKLRHLTKGDFSPREYGGTHFFDSKISFLN